MSDNFINKLQSVFSGKNICLTQEQAKKFFDYYNLLIEWNQKFNLTAITDENDVIEKHFLDSVLSLEHLPKNAMIIDLGSGAGFPGIPLKILREDLNITLVDSVNKKVVFLQEVISKLNLKNITAIHARIEDLANQTKYREQFDIVVSRAVSRLNVLCEYALPFLKINGDMVAYKSVEVEDEVKEAKKAISVLGGRLKDIKNISYNNLNRNLVIIEKVAKTDKKYPRGANKPRLNPIL